MQDVSLKEAGELLNTSVNTLRRWIGLLEAAGYEVAREGNRRQLSWSDVGALREIKLGLQEHSMDEAVNRAVVNVRKRTEQSESELPSSCARDPAQEERFRHKLQTLLQDIYWLGPEQAVVDLQAIYDQHKEDGTHEDL